jgi:hypothetical protein
LRAGSYKDASGDGACTVCVAGTANAATGQSACGDCGVNTYSLQGAEICIGCQNNSQSSAVSTEQTACACNAGYDGSTGALCVACGAGSWKDAVANAACTACVAGKANADTTSLLESACGDCGVNTYSLEGAETCIGCQNNSQSAEVSTVQSACACNAGYDGSTSGTCTACLAGNSPGSLHPQLLPWNSACWAVPM